MNTTLSLHHIAYFGYLAVLIYIILSIMASSSANVLDNLGKNVAKPPKLKAHMRRMAERAFEHMVIKIEMIARLGTLDRAAGWRIEEHIKLLGVAQTEAQPYRVQICLTKTLEVGPEAFLMLTSTLTVEDLLDMSTNARVYLRHLIQSAKDIPELKSEKVTRLCNTHGIKDAYSKFYLSFERVEKLIPSQ